MEAEEEEPPGQMMISRHQYLSRRITFEDRFAMNGGRLGVGVSRVALGHHDPIS